MNENYRKRSLKESTPMHHPLVRLRQQSSRAGSHLWMEKPVQKILNMLGLTLKQFQQFVRCLLCKVLMEQLENVVKAE